MSERKLTTKQRLFVEAYLKTANGVQSARRAGYKGTDATLRAIASENLTKLNIAAKVEKRIQQAAMSADEVLAELSKIAKGSHKIYRSDKIKSLELIGKHHKLFTDKTELTGKDGGAIELATFQITTKRETE